MNSELHPPYEATAIVYGHSYQGITLTRKTALNIAQGLVGNPIATMEGYRIVRYQDKPNNNGKEGIIVVVAEYQPVGTQEQEG